MAAESFKSNKNSVLPFSQVFLVPLTVIAGFYLGGGWTFLTPLLVFILIPIQDLIFGIDTQNPKPNEEKALEGRLAFRLLTWLGAPIQVGMVVWGAHAVTQIPMTLLEGIGFTVSMGVSSGVLGINISHELQHRVNNRFEPFLARTMLLSTAYMHWAIEHVRGHHKNVATEVDPATARLGESFYAFFPRTVFGGFESAWELEKERLQRRGRSHLGFGNRVVLYTILEIAFAMALGLIFGAGAILYFIVQSLVAVFLLEVVNYIEHYGLLRQKLEDGRYETVKPYHSWNSSNWLTNQFLFNLQRHSDHHYRPGRRYQLLRHFDESPQLPTGYAGMILLAVIPPLWRKVMDPKVLKYRQQHADPKAVFSRPL